MEVPQCARHLKLIFLERHPEGTHPNGQGYNEAFFEVLYKRLKSFLHRSPGQSEYGGDSQACWAFKTNIL